MQAEGWVGRWAGEWAGRLPRGSVWHTASFCTLLRDTALQQTSAPERSQSPTLARGWALTAAHHWPLLRSRHQSALSHCPVHIPGRSLSCILFSGKSSKAFCSQTGKLRPR